MSTDAPAAPIAGLLSLMADVLDPGSTAPARSSADVQEIEPTDLVAVLDHVVRGWLSVKQDGHGWLLVQFAPDADHRAEGAPEQVARERESVSPTPSPRFGSAEHKVSLLTDREREVLCLVAAGATNCAIGRRLFISPKTASVHVSHILTKLDASTRTEAAAYAHAAGLVQTWSPTGPHAVPDVALGQRLAWA